MSIKTLSIQITDMICISCENKIEKNIKKINGIKDVKANYKKGTIIVQFNTTICNYEKIISAINKTGYTVDISNKKGKHSELIPILIMIILSFFIVLLSQNSGAFNISSSLSSNVGYGVLFIVGVFSSLHCVGMCGGIMLSQSISINKKSNFETLKPSLLYNTGRLISYTILGGIVGGLGNIFSLSTSVQGLISTFAGIFMVVMGLNIYGFKSLRRFSFKLPWVNCNNSSTKNRTPFIVGLINGFMPCGPLQAMQLYALATGSITSGALSMFFFALGTIPLMLIFGAVSSLLSSKGSKNLLKISGVIVLTLGISMSTRGLSILGIDIIPTGLISNTNKITSASSDSIAVIDGNKQVIEISASAYGYSPKTIYVQNGIKTELIINGDTLTSCNNEVIFPSLNIRKKLSKGKNIIEFTPTDDEINFSCWMGMKRGQIKVVDNINSIDETENSSSNITNEPAEIEFYGLPLSEIPTSRLIKSTNILDNEQVINVTAAISDFEPLVIIAQNNMPLTVNFNISNIPYVDGEFLLLDNTLTETISSINIINGEGVLSLSNLPIGTYGLVKGNRLYTIIEVMSQEEFDTVDKESLRRIYF